MSAIGDLMARGPAACRPWPRHAVDGAAWTAIAAAIAAGEGDLVGLWGEPGVVHLAVRDGDALVIASLACADGAFPSVGALHPPALRLERTIRDLTGLVPAGSPDPRPWLDHGRWNRPPSPAMARRAEASTPYPFLGAEGEGLHQIPVGPVHAGIIEPGHFRFTASGETVVRLEERLGYVHKGTSGLIAGADLERAGRLAGRVSGDSTVAYAIAFARAVEAAAGVEAPPRAQLLRAVMAELERLANHFGDIGAICNDASFSVMHTQCGALRERVLRAADRAFGHRLMMDRVVPGGVATDLDAEGITALRALVAEIGCRFPELVDLYDNTASLQDRTVGTGVVGRDLIRQYGCGGFIGRASGRSFDARRTPGYAPYDGLAIKVATREEGDVNARIWVRIDEVTESARLLVRCLDRLPDGPTRIDVGVPEEGREGAALIEGFRGDVFVWARLGPGATIERACLRDPSWFQWPLLEAAIEGNIVADFPLCNKSFNCSYSGHDL